MAVPPRVTTGSLVSHKPSDDTHSDYFGVNQLVYQGEKHSHSVVACSPALFLQAIWTQLLLGNLDFSLDANEATKSYVSIPSVAMHTCKMDIHKR